MQDRYDGLCSLVRKAGVCYRCKGLQMAAPNDKKGRAFPDIGDIAARCAVVRECRTTSMQQLHDIFWWRAKEVEEQGLGSTEPESDCGTDAMG